MGDSQPEKKKIGARYESLGWLTESSIMPRKTREISGVGASSILELKAELYKSQQDSNHNSKRNNSGADIEFHRAKKKITLHDPFAAKNSGVDSRNHKDKLELKAVKDGADSYAALERKAELYDKLVRGDLPDEEDEEKYCVDFFRKNLEHDDAQPAQTQDTSAAQPPGNEGGETESYVLFNNNFVGPGRMAAGTTDNNEHKRFVREVHEEANQAREKVSDLKMRRQEQVAARREKLKQAYLRKQLEKIKAASNTEQQT